MPAGKISRGAVDDYSVDDRVKVKGTPHMEGHDQGAVKIVHAGPAYGVKFDGTDEVHKWYVGDELEATGDEEDETEKSDDMEMRASPMAMAADRAAGFLDEEYSWEALKPYLADDGQTLVIPVMDVVGDSFWCSGLSAKSVNRALRKHAAATTIKLIINSPGGDVHEGIAIFTMLLRDPRPVEAHVIGLAASMASVILLAADTRTLHVGAMVMVHKPSLWWTSGNEDQLQGDVDRLKATTASMLDIYEERTGASRAELEALVAKESWLTAEQARKLGFGTDIAPVEPEPLMAAATANPGWNARRGAALAKYEALPAVAQRGARLGWSGPSLAELKAANALAKANQLPTFAMALDGVRRSRAVAQQPTPPREATPPPRPVPQPQPAASTTSRIPMDEETLRDLGLSPGASNEQIAAAYKAKAAETKAKIAAAEAQAETERLARIEAQARELAAENLRKEQAAAAAKAAEEAKVNAEALSQIDLFLAGCTPGIRALYGEVCFVQKGDERIPKPGGLDLAKRMAETSPGALMSSLTGPSAQAQAARQTLATTPASIAATGKGPVKYRFAGATQEIDLTRLAGVTHEMVAQRQAEMEARAAARGQRVND